MTPEVLRNLLAGYLEEHDLPVSTEPGEPDKFWVSGPEDERFLVSVEDVS